MLSSSGSVATRSERRVITIMAEIIAWYCQRRVRALTGEFVPDTSNNTTKPGLVAGIYGFTDVVSGGKGRDKMQFPFHCKSPLQNNCAYRNFPSPEVNFTGD